LGRRVGGGFGGVGWLSISFCVCVGVGIVSAEASKWMKKPLKKGQAWLGGQKWCKDHFLFFCKLTLTARK